MLHFFEVLIELMLNSTMSIVKYPTIIPVLDAFLFEIQNARVRDVDRCDCQNLHIYIVMSYILLIKPRSASLVDCPSSTVKLKETFRVRDF